MTSFFFFFFFFCSFHELAYKYVGENWKKKHIFLRDNIMIHVIFILISRIKETVS